MVHAHLICRDYFPKEHVFVMYVCVCVCVCMRVHLCMYVFQIPVDLQL